MQLFETKGADTKYERWLEPAVEHEECGCFEVCHKFHRKSYLLVMDCQFCKDEACPNCKGLCYFGDAECVLCGGTGFLK
mgnify:CR=1 FL=1